MHAHTRAVVPGRNGTVISIKQQLWALLGWHQPLFDWITEAHRSNGWVQLATERMHERRANGLGADWLCLLFAELLLLSAISFLILWDKSSSLSYCRPSATSWGFVSELSLSKRKPFPGPLPLWATSSLSYFICEPPPLWATSSLLRVFSEPNIPDQCARERERVRDIPNLRPVFCAALEKFQIFHFKQINRAKTKMLCELACCALYLIILWRK